MPAVNPFKSVTSRIVVIFSIILCVLTLTNSCKTPSTTQNGTVDPKGKKLTQEEQLQLTALFIDGIREKSLGNEDKSMGLFAQCIKRDPTYAPAMYEMAQVFDKRNQESDALVMAVNAVKFEPENEWYQILLAGIYIKKKDYSEAAKVLKLLADKNPNTPDFLMDLANVFILAGKNGDAIKVYDDIEKKFGINEETSLQKEKLYLQSGKLNKAIAEVEKLSDAFPVEVQYMGILAELYLASGNELKGLGMYEKILSIDPTDPYVHLSLADYYRSKGNEEKSFEELKLAFANESMDIDNKIRILMKYFELSEHDMELRKQAYVLVDLMLTANPQEAKAWSMAGDYYYRDLRFEEASNAYRNVIAFDSSKYIVWSQLMMIESQLQAYTRLEQESAQALVLFPEQAELYLYNGFANIQLKQYEKAKSVLKTGLSYATDKNLILKIYINQGDVLYKLKEYDASFEAYEKALRSDPENKYVLNNYSFYLAVQKQNLSHAEELAKKLNSIEPNNAVYEDTYAWVLFAQEKYAEAKTWLEKSLEHGGAEKASILEHYGDVMYKLNDKDKALEYWQKAKDLGADSEVLKKKINDRTWYE